MQSRRSAFKAINEQQNNQIPSLKREITPLKISQFPFLEKAKQKNEKSFPRRSERIKNNLDYSFNSENLKMTGNKRKQITIIHSDQIEKSNVKKEKKIKFELKQEELDSIIMKRIKEKPLNIAEKFKNFQKKNSLINIEELLCMNPHKLSNFDYVLVLLEIVWNKEFFNLSKYRENSKKFWEKALVNQSISKILKDYSSDTLLKHYLQISDLVKDNFVELATKINFMKENSFLKRLSLCNFIQCLNENDIESFLTQENSNNENENESKAIKTSSKAKKCTKRGKKIQFHTKNFFSKENINQVYKKRIYRFIYDLENCPEKELFLCINEIIETFRSIFGESLSETSVIDCLMANSFNIQSTFKQINNYLLIPNTYFTQKEDFILINKKNSEEYMMLLKTKGESRVNERLNFLVS